MLAPHGFNYCFIISLLRHYAISSRFPLFYYLFVTTVSSSVCYVTIYSGYHCCASSSSEALQTQYTDVSEFDAEAPQATASEGLAQGPYVTAKTGLNCLFLCLLRHFLFLAFRLYVCSAYVCS